MMMIRIFTKSNIQKDLEKRNKCCKEIIILDFSEKQQKQKTQLSNERERLRLSKVWIELMSKK